jgi:aldehyde:ferredoxin oxidoreductase
MRPGYAGKLLFVDLGTEKSWEESLSQEDQEKFIGGYGVNASLAWRFIDPLSDPLSPESPLILGAGPFTGTIIPGASKLIATLKFPLNGTLGSAAAGCRFPLMLKSCGYDHIIVSGKAPQPVYLLISDAGIRLEDAKELWGMDIYQTTDHLFRKYEPCSVLPIGPAGENRVRISITLVDKGGTLGTGGLPALMGSKNLKAIVVKQGNRAVEVARRGDLMKLVQGLEKRMMKWPGREIVLNGGIRSSYEQWWGDPPARTPMEVGQDYMNDDEKKAEFQLFLRSRRLLACPSCPIGDKECIEIRDIKTYVCHLKQEIRGGVSVPEDDFYLKVKIQHEADRLGICLHTFSGLVSHLSGLQEDGVLTKRDLGVELEGGASSLVRLLEMIAQREGIGDILADGLPGLIGEFGDSAKRIALHNKGRYMLWDPRRRTLGTMEFGELTNPRGAHLQAGGSPSYAPGKALQDFVRHADRMGAPPEAVKRVEREGFNPGRYTKYSEDWFSLFSSLGLCNRAFLNRFYSIGLIERLFSSLTGLPMEGHDLIRAAERGWNLMRALNLRAGFTRKDDEPPDIWFVPLRGEGRKWELRDYFGEKITREDLDRFIHDYYDERGWDEGGRPTLEKLLDLGLEEVAGTLYGREE